MVILAKVILAPEKGLKSIFRSLPNKTTQVHWTSARILRKQFIDNHYDYVGKKCWSVCQIKDNAYTEGRGDMVADGIQGYHTRHAYTRIRVRNSHTASSRRERKNGEGGWRGGGEVSPPTLCVPQVKLLILPLYNVYQRVCILAEIRTSKLMQCLTSENINATKMCKFSRA